MATPVYNFVNRAYELDQICRPGAPRFILIDGAPGYGKTHLLLRVQDEYNPREWKTALVDLRRQAQMASAVHTASLCIAGAIVQQFPLAQGQAQVPDFPAGTGEAGIAAILVPFLVGQRAHILLLFDGVEVLSDDTSAWLKRLVTELDHGLKLSYQELRVVFAGRYASNWSQGAAFPILVRPLTPFDQMAVRAMVEQVVQQAGMHVQPGYLDDLAWWILRISGGHPRNICDMLGLISAAGFVFTDLAYTFSQQQFVNHGRTGTLFDLCIEPTIAEMLHEVPIPLREILAAISPVRRFDQELLVALFDQPFMAPPGCQGVWELISALLTWFNTQTANDLAKFKAAWELIQELLRTHLISPPTVGDPMFSDQIVRRMLSMQMQVRNPGRWQSINQGTQQIFDRWASGQGPMYGSQQQPMETQVRRTAIVESLYHRLQLVPPRAAPADVQAELDETLDTYLAGLSHVRDIMQLKDALQSDKELTDLIERQAGLAAMPSLLHTLDHYLQVGGQHGRTNG